MHINAVICVGKGYNILNDNLTPSAIFKMDDASLMETPFGVKIPAGMQMRKVNLQFAIFLTCLLITISNLVYCFYIHSPFHSHTTCSISIFKTLIPFK